MPGDDTSLITDFLDAVGVSTICPRCGNESWTLLFDGIGYQPVILGVTRSSDSLADNKMLSTFTVACNKCGYVSTHLRRVMDRWQAERIA